MKNDAFWAGEFGHEYHKRNRVDIVPRIPFWESAMQFDPEIRSALEVGCGPGWNLLAIKQVHPGCEVHGVDVHAPSVEAARQVGIEAHVCSATGITSLFECNSIDLVFTSGMLIHVAPSDLEATMRAIIDVSAKYVLAIEYPSAEEEEIEYRGHAGKLWKRPFGKLYTAMGLSLLSEGVAGGFDQCAYWMFEKAAP
jgi:pseudaminic acid biosynthesis-associated methylase